MPNWEAKPIEARLIVEEGSRSGICAEKMMSVLMKKIKTSLLELSTAKMVD